MSKIGNKRLWQLWMNTRWRWTLVEPPEIMAQLLYVQSWYSIKATSTSSNTAGTDRYRPVPVIKYVRTVSYRKKAHKPFAHEPSLCPLHSNNKKVQWRAYMQTPSLTHQSHWKSWKLASSALPHSTRAILFYNTYKFKVLFNIHVIDWFKSNLNCTT